MKSYFIKLITISFSILFFIAVVNFIIDPKNILHDFSHYQINQHKPFQFKDGGRLKKSFQALEGNYKIIIFGNSRAGAILKDFPEFQGQAVNLSLMGANIFETARMVALASNNKNIKKVIIALDFNAFSANGKIKGEYNNSLLSGKKKFFIIVKYLLSFRSFSLSLRTIKYNIKYKPSTENNNIIKQENNALKQHNIFKETAIHSATSPIVFAGYIYDKTRIEFIITAINLLAQQGVKIQLYISPIHAWHEEIISVLGLFDIYQQWKKDLTIAVDQLNKSADFLYNIELWDFSGYNDINSISVPLSKNDQAINQYSESSHFNPIIAQMVINQLWQKNPKNNFAKLLNKENIAPHLQNIYNRQQQYRIEHAKEVLFLKNLLSDKNNLITVSRQARWKISAEMINDLKKLADYE